MKTYRLAILTALATFVLLGIGGLVNPTGSSLACPDWPTCHGSFFPEMVGGVFFEHSHRIAATLVGFLTLVLAISVQVSRGGTRVARRAWIALGLVLLQGVLGGITVIFKLPPAVSLSHLALSMFFFAFVLDLCFRLRPGHQDAGTDARAEPFRSPRALLGWAGAAIYLQILLGGLVRHSGAGLACGAELPFCEGALWPLAALGQIHMAHRIFALAASALVLWAFARARRFESSLRLSERAFLYALPVLLSVQVVLGLLSVASMLGVAQVAFHLIGGAALLANIVLLHRSLSYPLVAPSSEAAPAPSFPVVASLEGVLR